MDVKRSAILLMAVLLLCSCTMTAVKKNDNVVALRGFGSGKAEFPDGTKIEKGLITLPPIRLDN